MYEALVARVRYHIQKANFMGLKEAESTLLLAEAADAIEELSHDLDSMNEANIALYGALPKWIPVTERLPEGEVLAVNKFGLLMIGLVFADGHDYRVENGLDCLCYVTHWMPLPAPPKEES